MNVLKFTLSGRTAFFKKPDVNSYYYFTYGNIHKMALLGILGAIIGYKGYNQQKHEETTYPEFYEKLKDIKVSIVPRNPKGYIPKKMQTFNNSVGYASQEKGGNLIVKEQWLEDSVWDIYILIKGEKERELSERIINKKFKYIPYLGKNDHVANITDVEIIKNATRLDNIHKIDSLFIKDDFEYQDYEDDPFGLDNEYIPIFKYQEMLPTALEEITNKYKLTLFVYTNSSLTSIGDPLVYDCNDEAMYFF